MGSAITAETVIDGNTTTYIEYFYDSYGPYGFRIDGTFYYYINNLQGDVTQIRDENNNLIASYVYDAWGKVLSVTENTTNNIGATNAIRYRGYYYDTESNLYYLNARYYDPQIKRFLNPDAILGASGGVIGYNMYAYCNCSPIIKIDFSENFPEWIKNCIKSCVTVHRSIVKGIQYIGSRFDLTYSHGVVVAAGGFDTTLMAQGGISFDTKGNMAIQGSVGGGISVGISSGSFSLARYDSITNAEKIDKLNDTAYQIGGSVAVPIEGIPLYGGIDINYIPNSDDINKPYGGLTTTAGLGTTNAELHMEFSNTKTLEITRINIFELYDYGYKAIMRW